MRRYSWQKNWSLLFRNHSGRTNIGQENPNTLIECKWDMSGTSTIRHIMTTTTPPLKWYRVTNLTSSTPTSLTSPRHLHSELFANMVANGENPLHQRVKKIRA